MIARRLVFFFPGFEPMRARQHAKRFERAATASAGVYDLRLSMTKAYRSADADGLFLDIAAKLEGKGFATRTDVVLCDWGDIILNYAARPAPMRIADGIAGLWDFLVTGTVWRYCRTSWRYAFFYLYPIVAMILAILVAIGGYWLADWVLPGNATFAGLFLAILGGGLVLFGFDRRYHLLTAMDDWALARDLCRGRNANIIARVRRQAETMRARIDVTDAEEVVVAAHSLGACLAVEALAKALAADDGERPRIPTLVTVGSSLMKTALHPRARSQRQAVEALVGHPDLVWIDCQSLQDPINFYKSNPATSLKLRAARLPVVMRVHFRNVLKPETYHRVKRNFFRIHRQFVLAVERRAAYSFHMLLLGPQSVAALAQTKRVDLPPLVPQAEEVGACQTERRS